MIDRITDLLTDKSPFPDVIPQDDARKLGFFRCDNDGYCWSATFWPDNVTGRSEELCKEFQDVKEALYRAFPTLGALSRYCEHNAKQIKPLVFDEYEMYLNLEYGCYWIRFITRKGDYNMYIHCYDKADAPAKEEP